MKVTFSEFVDLAPKLMKTKLVPFLKGSPGTGKSQGYALIAKNFNLKMIDLRLSQLDPTELNGFPFVVNKQASYIPMDIFPLEDTPIPAGYSGWLLLLDEITHAPDAVRAASYKLILDRKVGLHNLHKNVVIGCAGNMETDNAMAQPMGTAMQSRLITMELIVDAEQLIAHANTEGWDHRIPDFLKFRPNYVYTFKPDHTDDTYACSRTWDFANRILGVTETGSREQLVALSGALSEGIAREFVTFMKIYTQIPTIGELVHDPEGTKVATEPSILFAMSGMIGQHAKPENIEQLLKYISRMPAEFQVVTMRNAVQRNKKLLGEVKVQEWVQKSAKAMI